MRGPESLLQQQGLLLLCCAFVPLGAWAQPSAASPTAVPVAASGSQAAWADQTLYLEVEINRQPMEGLFPFELKSGQLWVRAATLRALRLQWPGSATQAAQTLLPLTQLPGLRIDFDALRLRLSLQAPLALLDSPPLQIGYQPPAVSRPDPQEQAAGLLLNYELYGQRDAKQGYAAAWNEWRLFGVGPGVWRSSQTQQWTPASQGMGSTWRSQRLDSSWQLDLPESMLSLTLGDSSSTALTWTRSMRYAGLRLARNFQLQPYRATVPLARYAGEAVLPSVVDLYINGIREAQGEVKPGRFQVVGAPVLSGSGQAQVVVTDILGQSRVLEFALYNSARLLQTGLSDWAVDLGWLRNGSASAGSAYAEKPFALGSLRYGLTRRQTLELHLQTAQQLQMAGVGGAWLLGQQGGVLTASAALSRHVQTQGGQQSLGYEWQNGGFSFNVSGLRRDRHFSDVAALDGAALPLRTEQAFMGMALGPGQLGASYVRQDSSDGQRARFLGLSWAQPLGTLGYLSLSLNRDLDGTGGSSGHVYWSMPLERYLHAWSSYEQGVRGRGLTVGAMRPLPAEGEGWGWRVQAGLGQDAGGSADLSHSGSALQWRLGAEAQARRSTETQARRWGYADASGALLLMQGRLFPMQRTHDAFALLSTDGIADVPVLLENRPVGKTDAQGLLLLPRLNAWQNNALAVDALALPADVSIQDTERQIAPAGGRGVWVRFPMKFALSVELSVQDAAGAWLPAGSPVRLSTGEALSVVGYDGRVYLQDPAAGTVLHMGLGEGACQLRLPETLPARGHLNLGVQPCR